MEDKFKKPLFYAVTFIIGMGLGLAIVGLFIGVVSCQTQIPGIPSGMVGLFDEDFDTFGINNMFTIVSFIITIIGVLILCIEVSVRIKIRKYIMPLHIAGIAVTVVGAVLVLVSGIMLAGDVEDAIVKIALAELHADGNIGVDDATAIAIIKSMISIKAGAGIYLGFIGGLISAIGSAALFIKQFMPDAPAAQAPVADTANATAATAATSDTPVENQPVDGDNVNN
mgnify:CR=1 FL=1